MCRTGNSHRDKQFVQRPLVVREELKQSAKYPVSHKRCGDAAQNIALIKCESNESHMQFDAPEASARGSWER